jgi:hypothetical protein
VNIYDDPNHPHYGPVRRLHVMLMQLFGVALPRVEARFKELSQGFDWTERMGDRLNHGFPEATVQRDMLRWFLSIYR